MMPETTKSTNADHEASQHGKANPDFNVCFDVGARFLFFLTMLPRSPFDEFGYKNASFFIE